MVELLPEAGEPFPDLRGSSVETLEPVRGLVEGGEMREGGEHDSPLTWISREARRSLRELLLQSLQPILNRSGGGHGRGRFRGRRKSEVACGGRSQE
jgi:hypothetical protein